MWETVDDPKFYAEHLSAVKVRRLWHWVERAMTGRYRYSLRCAFVTLVVVSRAGSTDAARSHVCGRAANLISVTSTA